MRALQRFGRNALARLKPVCVAHGGGEARVKEAME